MDLTKSTDEILDDLCRVVYEKLYGTGTKGLDAYIAGISEELDERNVQHVTNKKCMDKHREKYFKIDVLIPPMERFIMLKHRKHITRADMNQFRQQETSVGMKGLLVNFYNGVDVREATSLLPGEERRELAKQNPRLKGGSVVTSSTYRKLPAIGSSSPPPRHKSEHFHVATLGLPSLKRPPPPLDVVRVFATACASFFLTEGDQDDFIYVFADFLRTMTAANQYGTRYTSKYNTFRREKEEEVTDDVDQLRLPSKRVIRNLRTVLIGDEIEGESGRENHDIHSELEKNSLMPINAD